MCCRCCCTIQHTPCSTPRLRRYLSGLTCTDENVIQKGAPQGPCARRGVAFVAPDTSPRGLGVEGEADSWDFGVGAGRAAAAWGARPTFWRFRGQTLAVPGHVLLSLTPCPSRSLRTCAPKASTSMPLSPSGRTGACTTTSQRWGHPCTHSVMHAAMRRAAPALHSHARHPTSPL